MSLLSRMRAGLLVLAFAAAAQDQGGQSLDQPGDEAIRFGRHDAPGSVVQGFGEFKFRLWAANGRLSHGRRSLLAGCV